MTSENKALVVLDQSDIDTAIHAIEEAGRHLPDEEFRSQYGSVYRKLHAIDRSDNDSYRVK